MRTPRVLFFYTIVSEACDGAPRNKARVIALDGEDARAQACAIFRCGGHLTIERAAPVDVSNRCANVACGTVLRKRACVCGDARRRVYCSPACCVEQLDRERGAA